MRRNGILVIGLVLMIALAAGVLWATAPTDAVAEEPVGEGACHAEPVEESGHGEEPDLAVARSRPWPANSPRFDPRPPQT